MESCREAALSLIWQPTLRAVPVFSISPSSAGLSPHPDGIFPGRDTRTDTRVSATHAGREGEQGSNGSRRNEGPESPVSRFAIERRLTEKERGTKREMERCGFWPRRKMRSLDLSVHLPTLTFVEAEFAIRLLVQWCYENEDREDRNRDDSALLTRSVLFAKFFVDSLEARFIISANRTPSQTWTRIYFV